ncbi:MAG: tyrosine-type recombinase/integrase [Armatimonadota bacterium]|nr:tyrosine-type recombinase/integrase [Armatimonadota bacterium]
MSEWRDLSRFRSWLLDEGLAEATADSYVSDVRDFLSASDVALSEGLSRERVAGWLNELAEAGYAQSTIARKLTSVRRLCRWLMTRGELASDPTEGLSVAIPDAAPQPLREDAVDAVLIAPDPYSAIGIRDRAIMVLLADTGMELRELCALDISDCNRDASRLLVGSGRRLRHVRLYSSRGALLRYLSEQREPQQERALFLSNRGRRISERAVQHRVQHYAAEADVDVTVADLIRRGRRRRASGDPTRAARELGFARADAVQGRYRQPEADTQHVPVDDMPPHRYLEGIDGAHPGGMPAAPEERRLLSGRADIWARLEHEAVTGGRQPRPVQGPWAAAVERIWLPATERIRAYAGPASATIEVLLQCGATDDEVARAAYSTDAGLQALRQEMLQLSSDLQMWSRLHARYPGVRRALKRVAGERPGTGDLLGLDEDGWLDAALAMLTFGSPEHIIGWADSVLSTDEGQMAVWMLVAALWKHLSRLRECAVKYYGVPSSDAALSELDACLVMACVAALVVCEPSAVQRARVSDGVERPALMYFLDTAAVVLYQLLRLLGHVAEAEPLSEIEDDRLFARRFEREWEALLPHSNGFFGFAVVPRLGYEDMVRYHWLRYRPYGTLATIPYEVGDYLVHQAKGSMHFLRPFLPDHLQDAFYDCVRPLYSKLVEKTKFKARQALIQWRRGQDLDEVSHRAERETEAAFRNAYDRYDFYQHPPGTGRTQISAGLLGWRRRTDIVELGEALGIACEEARTPFAAYARGYLLRMVKRLRRESIGTPRGTRVQAPGSGEWYYTINKLASTVNRSAASLRRLDDVLKPKRVSELFGHRRTGRQGLPGDARLYPADGKSLSEYRELLSEQYPRLHASGLRTEAEVARWLGVGVWWLRSRRQRGLLEAGRRGHFVVYNGPQRIAARELLATEREENQNL